jgi:hypothetical protein
MAGLMDMLMGKLSPDQESNFQRDMQFAPGYRDWRVEFSRKYGGQPNLNDPLYNYRAAWASGVKPEPYQHDNGSYHWPSSASVAPFNNVPLKGKNHPTAWMEKFMQHYGSDPHEASSEQILDAFRRGMIPGIR